MNKITAKVDRQTTILLDFMFWSNALVLAFIVVINVITFVGDLIERFKTKSEDLLFAKKLYVLVEL